MYKRASEKLQSRADGIVGGKSIPAAEVIPDNERLEFIRRKLNDVEAQILLLPKGSKERKRLGHAKQILSMEMQQLKKNKRPNIGHFFMQSARLMLPKDKYEDILAHAQRVFDLNSKPDHCRIRRDRIIKQMCEANLDGE